MPALKSTLRFLALGACADMATAFGTIKMADEYIAVETESSGQTAPDCMCASNAYWYCNITGFPSLGNPRWPSMTLTVLAQSVNYCYNKCYKTSTYLASEDWEVDPSRGTCAACEGFAGEGEAPPPAGDYGCKCEPEAPDYAACNTAPGDDPTAATSADIWYNEICSSFLKPGGQLGQALDKTFQEIFPETTVTDTDGKTEVVPYNPFQHAAKRPESFATVSGGQTPLCQPRGAVDFIDSDPAVACAGVLADSSENVGDYTGCDTPAEYGVTSSDQCGKMYYYTATWVYYCKASGEFNDVFGQDFKTFCEGKSEPDCGTTTAPKHYFRNPWGKYNICAWKNNKCKQHWTGSSTPPVICTASTQDDASSVPPTAFQSNPSTCKQLLCGGGGIAGQDADNKACSI